MIHLLRSREKDGPTFITACGSKTKDYTQQTVFQSRVTCAACLLPGKNPSDVLLSASESGIIDNDSEKSQHQQGEPDMATTTDTSAKPTDEKSAETAPAAAATPKKVKAPLPEGFVTPVEFAHRLGDKVNQNRESIRPQIIYGYLKNNAAGSKNPFPAKQNSDGAWIVDEKAGFAWYDALQGRKATNAQKAAAKAAEAAKTPAPATTAATAPEPAKS